MSPNRYSPDDARRDPTPLGDFRVPITKPHPSHRHPPNKNGFPRGSKGAKPGKHPTNDKQARKRNRHQRSRG